MKPSLNAAAHLSVGVVAFLLTFTINRHDVSGNSDPARAIRPASGPVEKQGAARDSTVKSRMKAAEYQAAWDAIPARKWSRKERIEYQIRLLKEWAETDLEGALKAALGETWNRGGNRTMGESFTFHSAFSEVFVDRSEDVLKMIRQRKLGILESSILLEAWSTSLLAKDQDLYLTYLRGMDGADFTKALAVASGHTQDKAFLTKALDVLAEKAAAGIAVDGLGRTFFGAAVNAFSKDELMEKLRTSSGGMIGFYTSMVAMNYATTSRDASAEQVSAEIDSFPEDKQDAFAKALLGSYTGNANLLQTALDHLVDHEQWQLLDKGETSQAVQTMRQNADPVALAQWAASLPPREETTEMFHRGVEPYIRNDREASWTWIQQMEDGYWRDHALAEYSQVNLHVFNDPEKSAAAIGQIRDPAFLETVRGWRVQWEKQKGK